MLSSGIRLEMGGLEPGRKSLGNQVKAPYSFSSLPTQEQGASMGRRKWGVEMDSWTCVSMCVCVHVCTETE